MNQKQEESWRAYQKASLEHYKKRKRKKNKIIFTIVLVIFFLFFVVKPLIGEIVIYTSMPYTNKRYEVTLNQHLFEVSGESKRKVPIVPFFLYHGSSNSIMGWHSKEVLAISDFERYFLDVKVFNCFYSGQPIECRPFKKDIEEIKEEKKKITYSLKIYKYKNYDTTLNYVEYIKKRSTMNPDEFQNYQKVMRDENFKLIYDGPFVSDITDFIHEEGLYGFTLTGQYRWTTDCVNMGLVNTGEKIELINING